MAVRRLIRVSPWALFNTSQDQAPSEIWRECDQTSVFGATFTLTTESLPSHHDFTAIRQLDRLGSTLVRSIPAGNGSDRYRFSEVCSKVGSNRSSPLHGDGGSAFEDPRDYFAGGVFGIYPKVCVGIFPLKLGESAGNIENFAPVIFRLESVMCKEGQRI